MKYVILNYDKNNVVKLEKYDFNFNLIDNLEWNNNLDDLKEFLKEAILIGYDLRKILTNLLTVMYQSKYYKLSFTYFDIQEFNATFEDEDIISYIKKITDGNLSNFQKLYGRYRRVFRGLDYPKYLFDIKIGENKYYGYIVDFNQDKSISYLVHFNELNRGDYFTLEDVMKFRENNSIFILCVAYFNEESRMFTDYYFMNSEGEITDKCTQLINGTKNIIDYSKRGNSVKIICHGTIEKFRENSQILGKSIQDEFISLISFEMDLWDDFPKEKMEEE